MCAVLADCAEEVGSFFSLRRHRLELEYAGVDVEPTRLRYVLLVDLRRLGPNMRLWRSVGVRHQAASGDLAAGGVPGWDKAVQTVASGLAHQRVGTPEHFFRRAGADAQRQMCSQRSVWSLERRQCWSGELTSPHRRPGLLLDALDPFVGDVGAHGLEMSSRNGVEHQVFRQRRYERLSGHRSCTSERGTRFLRRQTHIWYGQFSLKTGGNLSLTSQLNCVC